MESENGKENSIEGIKLIMFLQGLKIEDLFSVT